MQNDNNDFNFPREITPYDRAILIDKKVVPCSDYIVWCSWWSFSNRTVKITDIERISISTVFLGLDHGYDGNHLWFETIAFGFQNNKIQGRYETWEEAEAGHEEVVKMVITSLKESN